MKELIIKLIPKSLLDRYVDWKRKRQLPPSSGNVEKDAGHYWSASEKSTEIRDMSHWRGVGQWAEQKWAEYGAFHWGLINQYLKPVDKVFFDTLNQRTALEWGPGGGANMNFLCSNFETCYGVDISESNLEECAKQMQSLSHHNFQALLIPSDIPEKILDIIPPNSLDFVLSTAVFQHFPSKEYSQRVLHVLANLMKPTSYGLIQIRYFDEKGKQLFKSKNEDYYKNALTFTSFEEGVFEKQLNKAGFSLISAEKDLNQLETNYQYFFFTKN